MEAGITKSYYCKVSRVENDAGFNAMEEGITKVIIAACVYSDENDARFIAMEAGITKSYYCNGTPDVNDACLIAMEAGIYMIITATHPVMKLTLVSQQSKLDELLLFFHAYSSMKITRVSLQSKLDELIQLLHTLTREIRVDNDISSSSFDCNETRVIFIEEYV